MDPSLEPALPLTRDRPPVISANSLSGLALPTAMPSARQFRAVLLESEICGIVQPSSELGRAPAAMSEVWEERSLRQ